MKHQLSSDIGEGVIEFGDGHRRLIIRPMLRQDGKGHQSLCGRVPFHLMKRALFISRNKKQQLKKKQQRGK
jgi:hypothetical protein